MAFLRKHKRSPFWYVCTRDPNSGDWVESSTGLRWDNALDTRKANRKADKLTAEENAHGTHRNGAGFAFWVPAYVDSRYVQKNRYSRYASAWGAIREFLKVCGLIYPSQIRFIHAEAYIKWRLATKVHGKDVGHNTALLELKFFASILSEAKRREFIEANPLEKMGIGREPQRQAPELTDQQIQKLREAFAKEPDWMQITEQILCNTGCRFREASIPTDRINLEDRKIKLCDSKRRSTSPKKFYVVPIRPGLFALLERIKKSGAPVTCDLSDDKNGRFNRIMRMTLGTGYSSRCYRVTFITRMHRHKTPLAHALTLTNHSTVVHWVYSRVDADDVRQSADEIPIP